MKLWYPKGTGNHQGLVIEDGTGRNVAVAYDRRDAPLLAAAPLLLDALRGVVELSDRKHDAWDRAWDAINAAMEPMP